MIREFRYRRALRPGELLGVRRLEWCLRNGLRLERARYATLFPSPALDDGTPY
jgi:hypothetical protein